MNLARLLLVFLLVPAAFLFAQTGQTLQQKPTATSPAGDDWLFLQGATNGIRKLSPSYYLTAAAAAGTYQPLDADLSALAALSGTNVFYYRSAAGTWTAVTIGTGISFTGGTLSSTSGGGNMSTTVYDTNGNGSVDLAEAVAWSGITSKPTTLSGYGITDAQSLDSDLTAISALSTTSFGRSILTVADAAAARTLIGAGTGSGSGTVTVVSSGSLTSTALVTGGGSQALQTPSATATLDGSGNISTPGGVTTGAGGSAAGYIGLTQGTAPSAGTTNITLYAPASVTSYRMVLPGAATTGLYLGTNSGGIVTLTQVAAPTGTIVGTSDTQTLTSKTLTAPIIATISNTGTITLPTSTDTLVGRATTDTLTNKRTTARVTTITSSATPTINTDNCDCVTITAQAAAITSLTTNLTGTPVNFDQLEIRIKDDGTARAITWGASFATRGATLPTTTTLSKVLRVYLEWNSVTSTWDCVSVVTEA